MKKSWIAGIFIRMEQGFGDGAGQPGMATSLGHPLRDTTTTGIAFQMLNATGTSVNAEHSP
jgi:hypothetical protein